MQKKVLAALVASVMAGQAMAITVVDDGTNTFTIGGHVGAKYDSSLAVERNGVIEQTGAMKGDSSRVNFNFEHKMNDQTTAFAKVEWGFDVTDINSNDGFLTNRLGYVGVRNDRLGEVVIGKAWSSFSQVAGYTDQFAGSRTGCAATGYCGGEGHILGFSRADDVLQYNLSMNGFNFSAQTQLGKRNINLSEFNKFVDGSTNSMMLEMVGIRESSYGVTLSYDLPMGLSFGVAYNQAQIKDGTMMIGGQMMGAEHATNYTAKSTVVGMRFEADKLYAAATYSDIKNRFLDIVGKNVYFSKARGSELYVSYQLTDLFKVETGYHHLTGDGSMGVKSTSELKSLPVGLVYTQGPVQLSATYEFQNSKLSNVDVDDAVILQARYYF